MVVLERTHSFHTLFVSIFDFNRQEMDATQFYAIAAGGSVVLLLIINSALHLTRFLGPFRTLIQKYFLLPMLVGRHRFVEPWTPAQVSFQLIYLAANVFCASFRVHIAEEASLRVGHLSLINMMPTYFGFHLSFICNMLEVSLATYRLFHTSTGIMSVLLGLLHVLIHAARKPSFNVGELWQMFGLIVSNIVSEEGVSAKLLYRQPSAWPRCFFCRCAYFACHCMKSSFVVIRQWPLSSLMLFGDTFLLTRSFPAFTYSPPAAPLRLRSL